MSRDPVKSLRSEYRRKKHHIKRRLKRFRSLWKGSDERIFSELCFCICTPQTNAVHCDQAIAALAENGTLFQDDLSAIKKGLRRLRFFNNKARYILAARELFNRDGAIRIKDKIDCADIFKTRQWFVKNVKGIGFKEASHFLRNIGFGKDIAILDVHILRNLNRCRVVKEVPATLSEKVYLDIEKKLKQFAQQVKIPLEEMDLLFWSNETGFIFR